MNTPPPTPTKLNKRDAMIYNWIKLDEDYIWYITPRDLSYELIKISKTNPFDFVVYDKNNPFQ